MVDLRLTRLLSGVHVFSIFAEVGMRTTKTGRRAPPFTALGVRFGLSCRCGFCTWRWGVAHIGGGGAPPTKGAVGGRPLRGRIFFAMSLAGMWECSAGGAEQALP